MIGALKITHLVQRIADVFRRAELSILRMARAEIARTLADPDASPRVVAVRQAMNDMLGRALRDGEAILEEVIERAGYIGRDDAVEELVHALGGGPDDYLADVNVAALRRLTAEGIAPIRAAVMSATRTVEDAYREVIIATTPDVIAGEIDRRKQAQRALDRFADRGITGFTDRSGRRWDLVSYTEMATRTQLARTMVDSHADQLTSIGKNLVIVSDIHRECSLCRPWEGEVLSLDGGVGWRQDYNSLEDRDEWVNVKASLAEARARGLLHPNCRHNIGLFIPGVTRKPREITADPEGDKANQTMRYYERQIRHWKRRKEVALDDLTRRQASARISAYQKAAAALAKSSGVPRQTKREQITGAR